MKLIRYITALLIFSTALYGQISLSMGTAYEFETVFQQLPHMIQCDSSKVFFTAYVAGSNNGVQSTLILDRSDGSISLGQRAQYMLGSTISPCTFQFGNINAYGIAFVDASTERGKIVACNIDTSDGSLNYTDTMQVAFQAHSYVAAVGLGDYILVAYEDAADDLILKTIQANTDTTFGLAVDSLEAQDLETIIYLNMLKIDDNLAIVTFRNGSSNFESQVVGVDNDGNISIHGAQANGVGLAVNPVHSEYIPEQSVVIHGYGDNSGTPDGTAQLDSLSFADSTLTIKFTQEVDGVAGYWTTISRVTFSDTIFVTLGRGTDLDAYAIIHSYDPNGFTYTASYDTLVLGTNEGNYPCMVRDKRSDYIVCTYVENDDDASAVTLSPTYPHGFAGGGETGWGHTFMGATISTFCGREFTGILGIE